MSPRPTMPPLTLVVPSTNQQPDTVDFGASIAWKWEGPSTPTGIDQWRLLGHEDIKEEKAQKGHGKSKDKGRLSS